VIWIDLGDADWRAVKVTAGGWEVVRGPEEVAFVRNGSMLALPEPVRGGNIKGLQKLINVQEGEFVLVPGWLLQVLNPIGPYAHMGVCGSSEAGKTTLSRILLWLGDPTSAGLRRASRVINDLMVAARNGWLIGWDNMSKMSPDWADHLSMLATGIATGTRAHYTNDEEHAYYVERPFLFNGIPVDLAERSDLASRTIKLNVPTLPVHQRRPRASMEEEFRRVWPGMFGALLDGLQGAMAGWREINVEDIGFAPARMMDFEQWAEAGCRAMGFAKWEFVRAYAANREGSMVAALEGHAVGRVVVTFMKKREKFEGTMTELYDGMNRCRGDVSDRDWPKDPTRLSTEMSRLTKPLDAIGITCFLKFDRRSEGGSQKDVVLVKRDAAHVVPEPPA
jgi:putative DNA primase/helicase